MCSVIGQIADKRLRQLDPVHYDVFGEVEKRTWCTGFEVGVREVINRLQAAKAKMVESYAKGLEKGTDEAAYHAALVVMSMEVEVILDEFKDREV